MSEAAMYTGSTNRCYKPLNDKPYIVQTEGGKNLSRIFGKRLLSAQGFLKYIFSIGIFFSNTHIQF
jgi:hypothetical protein